MAIKTIPTKFSEEPPELESEPLKLADYLASLNRGQAAVDVHVNVFVQEVHGTIAEQKACTAGMKAAEITGPVRSAFPARAVVPQAAVGNLVKRIGDGILVDRFHCAAPAAGVPKSGCVEWFRANATDQPAMSGSLLIGNGLCAANSSAQIESGCGFTDGECVTCAIGDISKFRARMMLEDA